MTASAAEDPREEATEAAVEPSPGLWDRLLATLRRLTGRAEDDGPGWRARTPTQLQMEAVECGAASLASILAFYGRIVPLEELRIQCGVSRDGSNAKNVLLAARRYGLVAKGFRRELEQLRELDAPVILFWNFNHFVVLEGIRGDTVYLNDPATGPRSVTWQDLDESFSGVMLTFEPGEEFEKGGKKPSLAAAFRRRLVGSEEAIAFLTLAGFGMVFTGLVIPIFSKVFVDQILVAHLSSWMAPLLLAMVLTLLIHSSLSALQARYLIQLQTKLQLTSSLRFFRHILRLPIEFFSHRYAGEIGNRIHLNDTVAGFLSGRLASNAVAAVLVIFYAVLMMLYSPTLTLIGMASVVIMVYVTRAVSRGRTDRTRRLLQEQGKMVGVAMGGLNTLETLKATGAEGELFSRWSGYLAKTVDIGQDLGRYSQPFLALPPALTQLTSVAVLSFGGLLVMRGSMTMGELVAFQMLMAAFLTPVNELVSMAADIQEMEGNMARLDDVMRYEPDPRVASDEAPSGDALGKLQGYVQLEGITFGYSPLADPLIEDFNLELSPGSRVALVGGSGSGKSTVAKLLAGLYEPWEGTVSFDGTPRDELPRTLITNSVAMVDQDISMYEGTITENLTLWDVTIPESEVVRAAKDAIIHDDITARDGGYDSDVEEGGANFSGGQRQRLEIARALVTNPRVLVLDEATSALDPLTEQRIDRHLRRRGCTCVIVAHRLSTIRDADEIIVLEKGKVVQRGTHDSLLEEADGAYAQLIES